MTVKVLLVCACVGVCLGDVYFKPRKVFYGGEDARGEGDYKTEILFPGNYYSITKEKSVSGDEGPFRPQVIPLIREVEKRSLAEADAEEDGPKEDEFSLMKRSISYILGGDDEDNDEEIDEDLEKDDLPEDDRRNRIKKKIRKRVKKYSKYMMPLLLAYKMKFFSLVPVMIAGLVLLVGATGMAGFFFALFAAVMGLQKGGY